MSDKLWKTTCIFFIVCLILLNIPPKSFTAFSNRTSFFVPMRDGEKLAGDLFSLNSEVPKPVILIQTPYDKSKYWTQFELRIPFSLENYNIFITDWRGRFASSSSKKTKSNNATDGYDVVEWIAKQKWSNGKVGTYGGSALGDVQFKTASQKPPHLVCAVPMVKDFRVDYETYYFGGEFRIEQIQALELLQFTKVETILSQPVMNQYWKTVEKLTDLSKTFAVPMLLITGWFDHYPDKVIRAFSDIQEKSDPSVRARHKLIVGPWGHGNLGEIKQGDLSFPGAENYDSKEAVRFMDYYLRGIQNSWELCPTIQYYQMGEERWLYANTWKEIKREELSFYLQPNHHLGDSPITCSGAGDYYLYDPANPTPSVGGKRFDPYHPKLVTGPVDQREKVENRADVLLYTSEPLQNNISINGLIQAEIYFSSNQFDTDISVRFCDIYPDGKSILMAEGIRRARFRNSLEKEELLIPEQIYKIKIDLQNIALTVLKGHKIRIIVSSASYPIFEKNPNNGGKLYEDKRMMMALNSIYHDFTFPSRIIFPINSEPRSRIYSAFIPQSLKPLYTYLETTLDTNHSFVDSQWDGKINTGYIPNASLIIANSSSANAGYLTSSHLALVEAFIKNLKTLGCKSVQLDLQFPIFDEQFFTYAKNNKLMKRTDPGASDYLKFYKNVAQLIRDQGLLLTIESQVIFTQKTYSQLPVKGYYQYFNDQGELGLELYKFYRLEMLKTIVRELSPDYLTICDEPDTEVWLTGIDLLKKKENYANMVEYFITGLKPLASKTKLGCGLGIWDENSDYWINRWSKLPIQFINIHMYGLDNFSNKFEDNLIPKLIRSIDKIQLLGKSVVMGECWLYKRMKIDTNDIEKLYSRNFFDSFIPLDISYLKLVSKIAHWKNVEYVSPFWSGFFFSYLTFDEAKNLEPADRIKLNNGKVVQNIKKGSFSLTGKAYQEMNLNPKTLRTRIK